MQLINLQIRSLAAVIAISAAGLFSPVAYAQQEQTPCFEYASRKTMYFPPGMACPSGWYVDRGAEYAKQKAEEDSKKRIAEKFVSGGLMGGAAVLLVGFFAGIAKGFRYLRGRNALHKPNNAQFARAFDEVTSGQAAKATWARALVEARGNADKANAAYIRLRARELLLEQNTDNVRAAQDQNRA